MKPVRIRFFRLCSHYSELLFVPTQKAIRYSNGTELEQVVKLIENRAGAVDRECVGEPKFPVLAPKYLLPSQRIPVLTLTYSLPLRSYYLFTLHQSVTQNLSDM